MECLRRPPVTSEAGARGCGEVTGVMGEMCGEEQAGQEEPVAHHEGFGFGSK